MNQSDVNQKAMTIKEIADKAGLTPRSIRYYEQIGLLNGISRDPYNRRRYTSDDLYLLKLIKRARNILNLSLEEIKELAKCFQHDPTEIKIINKSLKLLTKQNRNIEIQQTELIKTKNIIEFEIKRLKSILAKLPSLQVENSDFSDQNLGCHRIIT